MSLGVEYGCRFELVGPDGTIAVFNDSTDPNYVGNLDPEQCSGLDSPDVREDAADAVEEDGGIQGDNYYARRAIILAGIVIAGTPTQRNERVAKIKRASNAMRADATLSWKPVELSGKAVQVKVRRQQRVIITKGYVKSFQVPLASASALIHSAEEKTAGVGVQISTKSPGAAANEAGVGTVAWTNPSNALTSNNVYATASLAAGGAISNWLRLTSFGHTFPAGAKILGVMGKLERKKSGPALSAVKNSQFKIIKAGVIGGSSRSDSPNPSWPTSEAISTVPSLSGVPTVGDLWENTLTAANVEASNWGLALSVQESSGIEGGAVAELDQITSSVYYTAPVEPENAGDAPVDFIAEISLPGSNIVKGPIELLNETTGEKIVFNRNLVEGEVLVIDTKNRTVTIAGVSVYDFLEFEPTTWFKLLPGKTKLSVANAGLTIKYRDGYL